VVVDGSPAQRALAARQAWAAVEAGVVAKAGVGAGAGKTQTSLAVDTKFDHCVMDSLTVEVHGDLECRSISARSLFPPG